MSNITLPKTIYDVPTPCFLVDIEKVKRNAQRMIDRCRQLGVELRPHMKTHKTVEAGVLMTGGTKRKISVSTLEEARFYAENGFDDILYSYPITGNKIDRCRELLNQLQHFHLMFESVYALELLKNSPLDNGQKWSVFLEIDCGNGRSGVPWDSDEAITLAKQAMQSANITFQGLYTHCGNSYTGQLQHVREVGNETATRLLEVAQRLRNEGVECKVIGTGSTPCCSIPSDKMSSLTEWHPGNYVFYDYMQFLIGTCTMDDIACRVATRVVSHKPDRNTFLVDCGFLGLSQDGVSRYQDGGYVRFQDNPHLRMIKMSQELGIVQPDQGNVDFIKYPIGSLLFLYPHHSCATAALYPRYFVHSGEKIIGTWLPTRGW